MALLQPRLETLESDWLIVERKLVDEKLGPIDEIGKITNAEDANATPPRAVTSG